MDVFLTELKNLKPKAVLSLTGKYSKFCHQSEESEVGMGGCPRSTHPLPWFNIVWRCQSMKLDKKNEILKWEKR